MIQSVNVNKDIKYAMIIIYTLHNNSYLSDRKIHYKMVASYFLIYIFFFYKKSLCTSQSS